MELLQDEKLIWEGRPSWRSMLTFHCKWGFPALIPLIVVVLVVALSDVDWSIWVGIVITVVLLAIVVLFGWFRRLSTLYTITNRRLIVREGIISRREHSAHIDRIQNVNTRQGPLDRILHVGAVEFDTAGSDDQIRFIGIENPTKLRDRIAKAHGERAQELAGQPGAVIQAGTQVAPGGQVAPGAPNAPGEQGL